MPKTPRKKPVPPANCASVAPATFSPPGHTVHAGRLIRIEYIHDRLCEVRHGKLKISALSLGRDLSRSRNTILADLRAMRDSFRAPVTYDPRLGTLRHLLGARPLGGRAAR